MTMSCGQLKDYLSLRGLSVSGTKSELVARAFVAWEQKTQIKMETSVLQKKLSREYFGRLKVGNIPDPTTIGGEKWTKDVGQWPLIDMGKIFAFILNHKEFETDYIGKYKTEKAYSYFDSRFVGPMLCHVHEDKCILKTEVTPSQKVKDAPRSVWLCAKKDGEILTAWCDCTAGYSQTCNHIIAACYKIEYAITNELNKTASTSKACEWNKSGRKDVQPSKVKDMDLRGSRGSQVARESAQARLAFEPRRTGDDSIEVGTIQSFLSGLEKINKDAVLFTGIKMTSKHVADSRCPLPICDMANNVNLTNVPDDEVSEHFMEAVRLSPEQCAAIEVATRGQGNSTWLDQRKGRITATKAHAIHTKVNTLMSRKRKKVVISKTVANTIYGGKDISHLPNIAYGKKHEDDAKKGFYSKEAINHKKFVLESPGLYVSEDIPYLAASPDYIMRCECCGTSVIEIKCPANLESVTVDVGYSNTDFLEKKV